MTFADLLEVLHQSGIVFITRGRKYWPKSKSFKTSITLL